MAEDEKPRLIARSTLRKASKLDRHPPDMSRELSTTDAALHMLQRIANTSAKSFITKTCQRRK
jgi:hypothetical protein